MTSDVLAIFFTLHPSGKNSTFVISILAYKDGYKQVEIAQYLGLSKSHVSKVLKEVEI